MKSSQWNPKKTIPETVLRGIGHQQQGHSLTSNGSRERVAPERRQELCHKGAAHSLPVPVEVDPAHWQQLLAACKPRSDRTRLADSPGETKNLPPRADC